MNQLVLGIEQFIREEEGVTMVEYGLIAALISIVCLVALTGIGGNLKIAYTQICNALKTAVGAGAANCA